MAKSKRRRCRTLESCERQASLSEPGQVIRKRKAPVVEMDDDALVGECISNRLKMEWRALSQRVLRQLGAEEMAALCQELDVFSSDLNSGVHSDGTNKAVPTAGGGASSLQVHDEDVKPCDVEFARERAELEERYSAAVLRSSEREQELKTQISNWEKERDKQAEIIESYRSQVEVLDPSMRNRRHEEASPIRGTPSRSTRGGQDLQSKDLEISTLKDELTRVRADLEVSELRLELERKKKIEATEELIDLEHQKAMYDAARLELIELQNEKQKLEAEKSELRELRLLRKTFEAERLEIVSLRRQMEEFKEVKHELKDVYGRLASVGTKLKAAEEELKAARIKRESNEAAAEELSRLRQRTADYEATVQEAYDRLQSQESKLKAAEEELRTLRVKQETYDATADELTGFRQLRAKYEGALQDISTLQKHRDGLESAVAELAALRKQKDGLESVAAELEELRKHMELYLAERDELQLLRQRLAKLESGESGDASEHSERKEKGRNRSLKPSEVDPEVKREILSAQNAQNLLLQEKISLLRDKEVLQTEKANWLKEKQLLEGRLRQANEDIISLQSRIDVVEEVKARLDEESSTLNRKLFVKEAKIESLRAKLRIKKMESEVSKTVVEEVETLREANRASMETERRLKEDLNAVKTQLSEAASKDVCRNCFKNARDALHLPCSHVQCCVKCVKEMMQDKRPCLSCGRAITGFVRYISVS